MLLLNGILEFGLKLEANNAEDSTCIKVKVDPFDYVKKMAVLVSLPNSTHH